MNIDKHQSQRQIPRTKECTSNKLYTDTLYGYLQANCIVLDDKTKFLPNSLIKFTAIGEALEMTRQTTSAKFKNLIALGLVAPTEGGYELKTLPNEKAFLVSLPTLRRLVSALKERSISIYVYLLNRFIANQEQPFDFSIDTLKSYVGLSTKTRTNNYIISDILDILSQLGLITILKITSKDANGTIQTTYTLKGATNKLNTDD